MLASKIQDFLIKNFPSPALRNSFIPTKNYSWLNFMLAFFCAHKYEISEINQPNVLKGIPIELHKIMSHPTPGLLTN